MDIWEQGTTLGSNNDESNKMYGRLHWEKFISTHDYYFVEFNDSVKSLMTPMSYFRSPKNDKHMIYQKKFGYKKDFSKFKKGCLKIDNVISEFNFTFFIMRHNPIFKSKEFGQLCILIKELYEYGAFNYPCWRLENNQICTHPGQHLNFARTYLGLPLQGFISSSKLNTQFLDFINKNGRIIKHIKTDNDIIEILGTDKISASIQKYGGQQVPSLYPVIPRPDWASYDRNGNTDWPWQDVSNFYDYLESTSYIKIIDEVINSNNFTKTIEQYAVVHNNFNTEEMVVNNFIAFLLTEQTRDLNFELINEI